MYTHTYTDSICRKCCIVVSERAVYGRQAVMWVLLGHPIHTYLCHPNLCWSFHHQPSFSHSLLSSLLKQQWPGNTMRGAPTHTQPPIGHSGKSCAIISDTQSTCSCPEKKGSQPQSHARTEKSLTIIQ